MKKTNWLKHLSVFLCVVLVAALALTMSACGQKETPNTDDTTTTIATVAFEFSVVDANGESESFAIHTNKKTVGEALLELGLISGEESAYGLYVKAVNGKVLDYETDGKYWAFYVNGEYATTGVDSTEVVANASYMFKAE